MKSVKRHAFILFDGHNPSSLPTQPFSGAGSTSCCVLRFAWEGALFWRAGSCSMVEIEWLNTIEHLIEVDRGTTMGEKRQFRKRRLPCLTQLLKKHCIVNGIASLDTGNGWVCDWNRWLCCGNKDFEEIYFRGWESNVMLHLKWPRTSHIQLCL